MNYISDDFRWDGLSVLCYPGGYGGDFLCNLLQLNYDPNHKFFSNKKNKFSWGVPGLSGKRIDVILRFHSDTLISEYLFNKGIKDAMQYRSFIEKIYDEDFFVYKKKYIQYNRNLTMPKYLNNSPILSYHYVTPNANFSMHEMFPGASIFLLYTEKFEVNFFFKLLETIKNNDLSLVGLENLKTHIGSIITNNNHNLVIKKYKLFDNMIGIDAEKLFFEDGHGYEDEVEKILSDNLGRKIILNRNLLKKYKKDNKDLIKEMMNISEDIHKMSCKEIAKLILEDYFIDNRTSMTDVEFKFLLKKFKHFL
jgi:hypothetical protein